MRKKVLLHNRRPKNTIPVSDGTLKVSYYDGRIRFTPTEFTDHRHPKYDATAQCPEWDKTLRFIFGLSEDPAEMVRHFEEMLGWLVCPSQLIDCNVILFDEGNTVATDVIQIINGFTNDRLRFNTCSMVTNQVLPNCILESMKNILVIPFNRDINRIEFDPYTFDRIAENELPGVFNRCLDGLKRIIKRGGFDYPKECYNLANKWMSFNRLNHAKTFARKHLVKVENNDLRTSGNKIFGKYKKWAGKIYHQWDVQLFDSLESIGFNSIIYRSRTYFTNCYIAD